MLRLYYKIFVDMYFKLNQQNIKDWKFTLIAYLSAFLAVIFISIKIITESILDFEHIANVDTEILVKFKAVYMYFIPAIIFNYFLFIYNDRYEIVLKNYKSNNGKYMIFYMGFALLLFTISLIIM